MDNNEILNNEELTTQSPDTSDSVVEEPNDVEVIEDESSPEEAPEVIVEETPKKRRRKSEVVETEESSEDEPDLPAEDAKVVDDSAIKEGDIVFICAYVGSYIDGTLIPERERGLITVNSVKDKTIDSKSNPGKFIPISYVKKRS